ncbi:helix-turn-helix domain-containing protein [Deinococcus cellulosilyticus]|nr:helix-turn-helix transcriptional regulator [Deinococcus cellulosilyticus]
MTVPSVSQVCTNWGVAVGPVKLDPRAEQHGRLLKEWREDRGIKRTELIKMLADQGVTLSYDYVNKIEGGTRALSGVDIEIREAWRHILGVSQEEWEEKTGLKVMDLIPEPSPLTFEYEKLLPIPATLQKAIDEFGEEYPDLFDPAWQRTLAGLRFEDGMAVGPQTPEHWVDQYLLLKKFRRHVK